MAVSALNLLLAIVVILAIAGLITWVLDKFVPDKPPRTNQVIWLIAVILVVIRCVQFLGIV